MLPPEYLRALMEQMGIQQQGASVDTVIGAADAPPTPTLLLQVGHVYVLCFALYVLC